MCNDVEDGVNRKGEDGTDLIYLLMYTDNGLGKQNMEYKDTLSVADVIIKEFF